MCIFNIEIIIWECSFSYLFFPPSFLRYFHQYIPAVLDSSLSHLHSLDTHTDSCDVDEFPLMLILYEHACDNCFWWNRNRQGWRKILQTGGEDKDESTSNPLYGGLMKMGRMKTGKMKMGWWRWVGEDGKVVLINIVLYPNPYPIPSSLQPTFPYKQNFPNPQFQLLNKFPL